MNDLIITTVGGGLLGWTGWHVVDIWQHRPVLVWDKRTERWVRCIRQG